MERVNERPGIWRPLSRNKKDPKRAVIMCFVEQVNETPEAGPAGIIPDKQRVILWVEALLPRSGWYATLVRVLSVTTGDMSRRSRTCGNIVRKYIN